MRRLFSFFWICIMLVSILTINTPSSSASTQPLASTTTAILKIDKIKAINLSEDSVAQDGTDELLAFWELTEVDDAGGITENATSKYNEQTFKDEQSRDNYDELRLEIDKNSTVRVSFALAEVDEGYSDAFNNCGVDVAVGIAIALFSRTPAGLGPNVLDCIGGLAFASGGNDAFETVELIVPHSFSKHQFKVRVGQSNVVSSAEYEISYTVTYRDTNTNKKEKIINSILSSKDTIRGDSHQQERIKRDVSFGYKEIDGDYYNFVLTSAVRYHDNHTHGHCGFAFRQNDESFYLISLFDDDMHFFERTDGAWQEEFEEVRNTPPSIRNGRHSTNYLVVVATGDLFTAYINGQYAGQFRNNHRTNENVSLMAMAWQGEVECNFENTWIFGLD